MHERHQGRPGTWQHDRPHRVLPSQHTSQYLVGHAVCQQHGVAVVDAHAVGAHRVVNLGHDGRPGSLEVWKCGKGEQCEPKG